MTGPTTPLAPGDLILTACLRLLLLARETARLLLLARETARVDVLLLGGIARLNLGTTVLALSLSGMAGCGAASAENVQRAQKEYELSVGLLGEQNVPAAFEHLFKAVELDPDNPEPHQLLGNMYMLRGDLDKAEQELLKAKQLGSKNPSYGPAFVTEVENSLGVVLVHQKRLDEAISLLRDTAANILNRTPYLAWGNLGWAYTEKQQYKEAVDALLQAVRQQPRFCLGYYRLGKAYLALREFERAEVAFTHGLEVPDEGCKALQDAWHLRGETRAKLGRRADAIGDFERCVELSGDSVAGRACQGYLEATH